MAAPTVRNAVQSVFNSATSGAVTLPTNVDGDLLVVAIHSALDPGANLLTPSGWTKQFSVVKGASVGCVYIFTKVASSEPSTVTFSWTAAGSRSVCATAVALQGAKTSYFDFVSTGAFGASVPIARLTTTRAANPTVLAFYTSPSTGPDPVTASAGWAGALSTHSTGTSPETAAFTSQGATQAAGTQTVAGTFTNATGSGSNNMAQASMVVYDTASNVSPAVVAPKGAVTYSGAAATVTATGTDPDGTVVAYLWELLSGNPEKVTLTNTTSQTVTVTPASASVADTFGLRCTVTDNNGGTAFCYAAVTALPAVTSWAAGI